METSSQDGMTIIRRTLRLILAELLAISQRLKRIEDQLKKPD